MYIVLIRKQKHSAWITKEEAFFQASILREAGYKTVEVKYEWDIDKQNGYYFM